MNTVYLEFPHQSSFSITTNSPELVENLHLQYGKYLKEQIAAKADFEISATKGGDSYHFLSPQDDRVTKYPLHDIDAFIFNNNVYEPSVFAMHGAAVEWQGDCYIFLAPTTSGKTTLTAFLTSHGFRYLTDDCILLDRSELTVCPQATPIQLRDGGLDVLRSLRIEPKELKLLEEAPALRRFVYTPQKCTEDSIPLKAIYFINRTKNENKLISMSTTERITELMKSPITQYPVTAEHLRFITRLSKTDCYRLNYHDMNYVKELIQNG